VGMREERWSSGRSVRSSATNHHRCHPCRPVAGWRIRQSPPCPEQARHRTEERWARNHHPRRHPRCRPQHHCRRSPRSRLEQVAVLVVAVLLAVPPQRELDRRSGAPGGAPRVGRPARPRTLRQAARRQRAGRRSPVGCFGHESLGNLTTAGCGGHNRSTESRSGDSV
jgi:hypothetical protein